MNDVGGQANDVLLMVQGLVVTWGLKERLEAAGCSIPYPQRDVHMHTVS
jgi:small-conductance mechanosensitive channel